MIQRPGDAGSWRCDPTGKPSSIGRSRKWPLIALVFAAMLWVDASDAQGRRRSPPPQQPSQFSYLEVTQQVHTLRSATTRVDGEGTTWRFSYQASAGLYLFYHDGSLDFEAAGRGRSTGYGLGLVYPAGDRGQLVLEAERARSEEIDGTLRETRASGRYFRLSYLNPVSPRLGSELTYVRGEFSGTSSNRYELGLIYQLEPIWSLALRIGTDADSDYERSETKLMLRYHY